MAHRPEGPPVYDSSVITKEEIDREVQENYDRYHFMWAHQLTGKVFDANINKKTSLAEIGAETGKHILTSRREAVNKIIEKEQNKQEQQRKEVVEEVKKIPEVNKMIENHEDGLASAGRIIVGPSQINPKFTELEQQQFAEAIVLFWKDHYQFVTESVSSGEDIDKIESVAWNQNCEESHPNETVDRVYSPQEGNKKITEIMQERIDSSNQQNFGAES